MKRGDGFVILPPYTDSMVQMLLAEVAGLQDSPEARYLDRDPLDGPHLVMAAAVAYSRRLVAQAEEQRLPDAVAAFLSIVEQTVIAGDPSCLNHVEVDVFEVLDSQSGLDQRLINEFGPKTRLAHGQWLTRLYLAESAWNYPAQES